MTKSLERSLAREDEERHAPDITYDEQFYPARPRRFRPSARRSLARRISDRLSGDGDGAPVADNRAYVEWLVDESMLADANRLASQLSGQGSMWQNPYAHPDPRAALERASVWFTAYPLSFVTRRGETFLSALADTALWQAFRAIGIDGVHTGPIKRAGGLNGRRLTPSVDGHFDRISHADRPRVRHRGRVPPPVRDRRRVRGHGHRRHRPGPHRQGRRLPAGRDGLRRLPRHLPHGGDPRRTTGACCPTVPAGRDSVNLDGETERRARARRLHRRPAPAQIFYEPGVKETDWSATRVVAGVDGVKRRWVYLHYFKEGQPTLNWLDPSFAAQRLVIGDALHALGDLGERMLRLDANGFLGIEDRRGPPRVVGGAPAVGHRQPAHRGWSASSAASPSRSST